MTDSARLNCWEVRRCGCGPEAEQACPVAVEATSDGVNEGTCAGRICWTVTGTRCSGEAQGSFVDKLDTCLKCDFFQRVKQEQGDEFRLLKLSQGVRDAPELHATIARIESFLRIHEQLHAQFDLRRLIDQITREAQRTVNAERSVVFLLEGDPPELRGEFPLRGEAAPVTMPMDENSAVGTAAVHNHVVNVRDPYAASEPAEGSPVFSQVFDRQWAVTTHSLLAAPIRSSDGEVIGVLTAANSANGAFSADDQWFMEQYALQVGLAAEKARLLKDSFLASRVASFGEALAGLSHSLKGITHALRGLTYIIRQAAASGRSQDIEAACAILDRQVRRVVDLSMAVAAYELERSGERPRGPLSEVVSDVMQVLQEEATARAIALTKRLGDGTDARTCDRVLVYRCLVNLLCHAFNACPVNGGSVSVTTSASDPEEAVVEVTHNGPVRTPEADAEVKAVLKGSRHAQGIGLPTASRLAREHGGRLEFEPQPEGGATYRLHVPLYESAE